MARCDSEGLGGKGGGKTMKVLVQKFIQTRAFVKNIQNVLTSNIILRFVIPIHR